MLKGLILIDKSSQRG